MDPEGFVRAVEKVVRDAAVSDVVRAMTGPAGRKPSEQLLALAAWRRSLGEEDRALLVKALKLVADSAVFGFLCVLDGARAIESGANKGELRLLYSNGAEGDRPLSGPTEPLLHEFFKKSI